jgi:hypothetical protein
MTVKGVLWHSTGANNPTLKRYVQPSDSKPAEDTYDKAKWLQILGTNNNRNDWNHIDRQAGLNCWIGKLADGTVTTVQTMPWDYRPWGCGSGPKGSCNSGWIQFEICEDGLTNKDYFDKIYQEACEITAYLCQLYDIDPQGTVRVNGVDIPTILCHADSNKLGFGSNHGDVNHWFPKHGKSMATARADVAKLMNAESTIKNDSSDDKEEKEIYRVRKDWKDNDSQIGAYSILENAKKACDKAGLSYSVFNSKGEIVYPPSHIEEIDPEELPELKLKDAVYLKPDATYASGAPIPKWLFGTKLYVREIRSNNTIVVSTVQSGPITGVVKIFAVDKCEDESVVATPSQTIKPYLVKVIADVLNVRSGPSTSYRTTTQVKKNQIYTIIGEKNGWGKLKSGAGWISLDYTKKI